MIVFGSKIVCSITRKIFFSIAGESYEVLNITEEGAKIVLGVYDFSEELEPFQGRSIPSHLSREDFKASLENALYAEGSCGVIVFTLEDVLREDKLSQLIRASGKVVIRQSCSSFQWDTD